MSEKWLIKIQKTAKIKRRARFKNSGHTKELSIQTPNFEPNSTKATL